MAKDALTIIKSRWPDIHKLLLKSLLPKNSLTFTNTPQPAPIFKKVQLCSGFDRFREAQMQASLIPNTAEEATLYGLVSDDLPFILLQQGALKRLRIILLNLPLTRALLDAGMLSGTWMQDQRVCLSLGESEILPSFPFTSIPPCLTLAERNSQRISDFIRLELSTLFINSRKQAEADEYLTARVNENAVFIAQDRDVASLFTTRKHRTFLVAGAGPTLTTTLDLLTKLKQCHPLIAVDAALTPLVNNGIFPDYTVSIDPQAALAELFFTRNIQHLADKALVYFPTVHSNVISAWQGPRFAAYTHGTIYRQLKTAYPRGELFSAGSVIHPAVDLGIKMGGSTIIFFGVDFAFPFQTTHATGCAINHHVAVASNHRQVINGHGAQVSSQSNLIGYLRDLENYIIRHPTHSFINTSREGAAILGTDYYTP